MERTRTASQNLGWMDSVGPVTVAPGRPVTAEPEPGGPTCMEGHGPHAYVLHCRECGKQAPVLTDDEKKLALSWLDDLFVLKERECSAWQWFVLKCGGSTRKARRLYDGIDADRLLYLRAKQEIEQR